MYKKKILYLIDYPLDLPGGAQLSTKTICDCMIEQDEGYIPYVICPQLQYENNYPYEVYEIGDAMNDKGIFSKFLTYQKYYRRIIPDINPDIVHAQMPMAAMFFGIMKRMGLFKGIKFVFTDRAFYDEYSRRSKFLLRRIYKTINIIVCTTDANRKLWSCDYTDDEKIKVVYNCVTPEFDKRAKEAVIKNDKYITVGFAGRMTDMKNWPLCKEITRKLLSLDERCKVKIVLSAFGDKMRRSAKRFGTEMRNMDADRVEVLHELNQTEMADFYRSLDVFILTSKFESFGKTAIEAMAFYCVVLGTDVGGLPEVIGKKSNVFSLDDSSKCLSRIQEYLDDNEMLMEEKKWFRKRYVDTYTVKQNYDGYIRLYRCMT